MMGSTVMASRQSPKGDRAVYRDHGHDRKAGLSHSPKEGDRRPGVFPDVATSVPSYPKSAIQARDRKESS